MAGEVTNQASYMLGGASSSRNVNGTEQHYHPNLRLTRGGILSLHYTYGRLKCYLKVNQLLMIYCTFDTKAQNMASISTRHQARSSNLCSLSCHLTLILRLNHYSSCLKSSTCISRGGSKRILSSHPVMGGRNCAIVRHGAGWHHA